MVVATIYWALTVCQEFCARDSPIKQPLFPFCFCRWGDCSPICLSCLHPGSGRAEIQSQASKASIPPCLPLSRTIYQKLWLTEDIYLAEGVKCQIHKSGAGRTVEGSVPCFSLPPAQLSHLRSMCEIQVPGPNHQRIWCSWFRMELELPGDFDRLPGLRNRRTEEGLEGLGKRLVIGNFSTPSFKMADSHCRRCTYISVSAFAVCGQWSLTAWQGVGWINSL